jgi:sensor histidine kinase YesM
MGNNHQKNSYCPHPIQLFYIFQLFQLLIHIYYQPSIICKNLSAALCHVKDFPISLDLRLIVTHNPLFVNISLAFAVSLLVGLALSVFISHRIAGPIYRLVKYFERINEGQAITDIHFRKGDYLFFFSSTINSALKKISGNQTPNSDNSNDEKSL